MRPSAHGDVVHSRPVAVNYGTDASPKVVVFYAGNDGVLKAINGNRTASIGSVAAGKEIWSFVPPEFFAQYQAAARQQHADQLQGQPDDVADAAAEALRHGRRHHHP